MEENRKFTGNEVEELLKWLDGKPKTKPIPNNVAKDVISLLINQELEDNDKFNEEALKSLKNSAESILINRMQLLGYDITLYAAMMMVLLIEPLSPGNIVTYAYYLSYKCKQAGIKQVRSKHITSDWFGFGLFHESDLEEFWNKQKGGNAYTNNLLDYEEAFESLKYKEN